MKSLPFILVAGIGLILFFLFSKKASADTSYSAIPNDVSGGSGGGGSSLTSLVQKGLAASAGTVALPGLGTVSAYPVYGAVAVGSEILEKKTGVTAATAINPGYEIPKQTILAGIDSIFRTVNQLKTNPAPSASLPLVAAPTLATTNLLSSTSNRIFGSNNVVSKTLNKVSNFFGSIF